MIEAQAPLANLFGYSNAMRGLSQGRATCTMEPHATAPRRRKCWRGFCRRRYDCEKAHQDAGANIVPHCCESRNLWMRGRERPEAGLNRTPQCAD